MTCARKNDLKLVPGTEHDALFRPIGRADNSYPVAGVEITQVNVDRTERACDAQLPLAVIRS